MLVPPWVESLLNMTFFSVCRTHGDTSRSECNMYCLDCNGNAFCFYCRSSRHKDHRVIKIRRSSYHDVMRVLEIQKVLDITGVQTYVINNARVLFLNERPRPRSEKGTTHICGRSLLDIFRFCSLGCKKRRYQLYLEGKNEVALERREVTPPNARRLLSKEEELCKGSQQDIHPPTPPLPPLSNARGRKGIPHRAPFGS